MPTWIVGTTGRYYHIAAQANRDTGAAFTICGRDLRDFGQWDERETQGPPVLVRCPRCVNAQARREKAA